MDRIPALGSKVKRMKRTIITGISLLLLIVVLVSCAPQTEEVERELDQLSDEELLELAESADQGHEALVGQAGTSARLNAFRNAQRQMQEGLLAKNIQLRNLGGKLQERRGIKPSSATPSPGTPGAEKAGPLACTCSYESNAMGYSQQNLGDATIAGVGGVQSHGGSPSGKLNCGESILVSKPMEEGGRCTLFTCTESGLISEERDRKATVTLYACRKMDLAVK